MKKILILCLMFIAHAQAMKDEVRVKIAARDVLQQRIIEEDLDEHYGKKDLASMYALADQEKYPQEVLEVIQSIIQARNEQIKADKKAREEANAYRTFVFGTMGVYMEGLESIHRRQFINVLLKDHPAVSEELIASNS